MSAMAIKLKEAKRQLYFLLLNRKEEEFSDTEIDLLFYLSKDKQIQEIYKK